MRAAGVLPVIAFVVAAPAAAQPARPGSPESGPPAAVPSEDQDAGGRRSLRGCPVDRECDPDAALRELELAAFPPPGTDPWIDDRAAPRGGARRSATVTRPSQLRPDQPWLDDLVLPDLPVTWTRRLVDYLVFYKEDRRGHAIMTGWLEAQGRFRDLIVPRLRAAGLPEDLLYVAMIESGYRPQTVSYAGAAGLWQFMPDGGRIYGLRIDRWVDERLDPVRSTIAVVDYWRDLHQRFGDWHLALAGYNAGYGAVLRSIARYNTNDYWRLSELENALPWPTTLYVPKALAAAICGANRDRMGFSGLQVEPAEAWDAVAVPASRSLATIARAIGVDAAVVERLNPHLLRGRTPPGEAGYVVRVPRGAGDALAKQLAELGSDGDDADAYVMAYGERFEDVAMTFGISIGKLRANNGVAHDAEVGGGSVLAVPRLDARARDHNRARAIEALHASGVDQRPGEPLLVAVPDKDASIDGKRRVLYRVVAGDSPRDLARVLGVRAADLLAWNGLADGAGLHPRMVLQAWVAPGFDAARANVRLLDDDRVLVVTRGSKEHLDIAEARVGRVRVEYAPKRAESLEVIGKKFGLGPRDLARINQVKSTAVIEPGQTIIVYRVVDRTRSKRAAAQWNKTPAAQRARPTRTADRVAGPVTTPGQLDATDGDAGHP